MTSTILNKMIENCPVNKDLRELNACLAIN